ncbi:hypothetical protein ACX3O0_04530 [Homoserinimonas sp. A447]
MEQILWAQGSLLNTPVLAKEAEAIVAAAWPALLNWNENGQARDGTLHDAAVLTAEQMQADIFLEARQGIGIGAASWTFEDSGPEHARVLGWPKDRPIPDPPEKWAGPVPALILCRHVYADGAPYPSGNNVEWVDGRSAEALLVSWRELRLLEAGPL